MKRGLIIDGEWKGNKCIVGNRQSNKGYLVWVDGLDPEFQFWVHAEHLELDEEQSTHHWCAWRGRKYRGAPNDTICGCGLSYTECPAWSQESKP